MAVIVIRYETTATACWTSPFIVRAFFNDTITVAVWTRFHVRIMRMLSHLSNGRAAMRGMMHMVLFAGASPPYPRKPTFAVQLGMSALGHKRTHAAQQKDRYSITFGDNHGTNVVTASVFDFPKSRREELVSHFVELPRMTAASYRQQLRKSLAERI